MKEIVNKIRNNIKTLNSIHIVDNHEHVWKREQIIFKFESMIEFLNENEYHNIDLRKFDEIYKKVQTEMDQAMLQWL